MDGLQTSPDIQFKTKLCVLTAIDLTIGVVLFLLSLYLLGDYFREVHKTAHGELLVMTSMLAIFAVFFITDPVMSLTILLRHAQMAQLDETGMLRRWLKMCNACVVLVVPEMFFFLTFYSLYQFPSSVGFILCTCKLGIYFQKTTLVANYLQLRRLTAGYNCPSGSVTPEVPSYGAFGPPSYEDAMKNTSIAPLGTEGRCVGIGEKDASGTF